MSDSNHELDTKRCSKCGEAKPLGDFYTGPRGHCKSCENAWQRKWYAANPEKIAGYRAAYRAKHIAEQGNPDPTARDRSARYYARHPERVRAAARRRARARYVGGDPEGMVYIDALDGDPCSYCGGPSTAIDHITPKAEGGPDRWDNLTAVCRSCNGAKRTIPLLLYLLRHRPPVAKRHREVTR